MGYHLRGIIRDDAELEEVSTNLNIVENWFNQWPHPRDPWVDQLIALLLGEVKRDWIRQMKEYRSRLPE